MSEHFLLRKNIKFPVTYPLEDRAKHQVGDRYGRCHVSAIFHTQHRLIHPKCQVEDMGVGEVTFQPQFLVHKLYTTAI